MIYGLYLSATGVITNMHQADVIANNLANTETSGFKRQLALFEQRSPEALEDPPAKAGDRFFDLIGGGKLLSPSLYDQSQGSLEQTSAPLDMAINGDGFFGVQDASGTIRLTRSGQFAINNEGYLVHNTQNAWKILDANQQPIRLQGVTSEQIQVGSDGSLIVNDQPLAQVGRFSVPDPKALRPIGQSLLAIQDPAAIEATDINVISGFVERSNVDPAIELTRLIEAQRMLEANANMIRYQDQTLSKLVNEVGKIG